MNEDPVLLDLRPNTLLLNASFDGYKLSLDSIPTYKKKIEAGVFVKQPAEIQYSFCHVKIFSLHNHLHANPFKPESVYVVDSNREVVKIVLSAPDRILLASVAFKIPEPDKIRPEGYNVSMVFPSDDTVLLSDGCGAVHLVKVEEEQGTEVWNHLELVCQEKMEFVLLDAHFDKRENEVELHFLLVYVEEKAENKTERYRTGLFQTLLLWKTYKKKNLLWEIMSEKKFKVDGSIDYVSLESDCQGILVISDKVPKLVIDTEKTTKIDSQFIKHKENYKLYTWTQSEKEITVWLPLEEGIVKSDLEVTVTDSQMEIKLKGNTILCGNLFQKVDKDLTSWVFEKNQLEIQLFKLENLQWKILIPSDEKGEEIFNSGPDNDKNKLSLLCLDKEEGGSQLLFNSQQLEECDNVLCDGSILARIDGINHVITHQVNLSSSPWLFKVSLEANLTPAICCRHDVDACVWQFRKIKRNSRVWPYEHIGTFLAFGYVQASKTQKKFLACPPNLSYVVICDASHHIYIYRQPGPLLTELKNRQTGKKINMISKQQLVNLESREQIMGVHATDNFLFVLLETSICILTINSS